MGNKPKSIVVLSGGQDSATCLFKAKEDTEVVGAVHFVYGQRHAVEGECAFSIASRAGVPLTHLTCMALAQMADSALVRKLRPPLGGVAANSTDDGRDINEPHHRLAHLPASFVPGRNLVLLTLAAGYAMKCGATQIWTGVCQTDYSGYPDCRRDTIDALQSALRLGMDFPDLEIVTPLMDITKAQTFAMAEEMGILDVILEDTHTCYNGDRTVRYDWGYGCGSCPACEVRARGWDEYVTAKASCDCQSFKRRAGLMEDKKELPRSGPLPRPESVQAAVEMLYEERIDLGQPGEVHSCTFTCDEFTSVCPRTGQPDSGRVIIYYVPHSFGLESKSLKFYLWSYREEGAFCEDLARRIADDVHGAIHPRFLCVTVEQNPRGGIKLVTKAKRYGEGEASQKSNSDL